MPLAGLLALLDDVTTILDDVATMTKVASQKTAAIVGDDLALNANQLTGISAAREIPILAQVAKGSLINKIILIPAALVISYFTPWLVVPLLMIGGAFLCYEGAEKVLHKFFDHAEKLPAQTGSTGGGESGASEKEKIRGAVLTDFILSAEIIIIALGATASATLTVQALSLILIGLGMTVAVYGLVALIIKADDFGLYLLRTPTENPRSRINHKVGRGILTSAPLVMRALSVLGTAAMFLVGGEILVHGLHAVESFISSVKQAIGAGIPLLSSTAGLLMTLIFGFLAGLLLVGAKSGVKSVSGRSKKHS